MSDNPESDDPIQRILSEADDGLKPSGHDAPAGRGSERPVAGRPGGNGGFPRGPRARNDPLPRWLLAAAAVAVVVLVVIVLLYLSQANRLKTLEQQVATLQEHGYSADDINEIRAGIQRVNARVDALTTRINTVDTGEADIQTVKELATDQGAKIESLSRRVAELEKGTKVSGKTGGTKAGGAGSRTAATGGTGAGGSWVVNLISVADAASAEHFEKRLKDMGVQSRIDVVDINGKTLRRVVATGFDSEGDAKKFAASIKAQLSLSETPWVSRD